MNDCIFCRIVKREIPATVIHEEDDVLVIMDIGPIIKGHALVIPKKHYDPVGETPDDMLARLHIAAKKIARVQMNALGADGVNIMQNNGTAAGQEVPHFHIHVIPRFKGDGHHWNWKAKKYTDFEEMEVLANKMRDALQLI
jgi:histidine triad (HIT) family protein